MGGKRVTTYKRRLLNALFLALRNFANFKCCHEQCSGRCPRDVFIRIPFASNSSLCIEGGLRIGGIKHIGVGFDVARSTVQGNAKASESGTSDG